MDVLKKETPFLPEDVDYKAQQLDVLDDMYKRQIDRGIIQCASYVLSRHGKVFASRSIGPLRGYEDKGPFKTDSIRMIASITKVFTATALMQLVEKGYAILESPVSQIIKEFDTDIHKNITLQQLVTHTSGLTADAGAHLEPYPAGWWNIKDENMNWIKKVIYGPLQHPSGKVWGYCSGGIMILGEVISRLSGMAYHEYVKKNILDPLEMNDSYFALPEERLEEVCFVEKNELEQRRKRISPDDAPPAGGGLHSTAEDLIKFANMMLNKGTLNGVEILSRKTVEHMTRSQLHNIPCYLYGGELSQVHQGIGWRVVGPAHNITSPETYKHEGAGASGLYVDPKEGLCAAYFVPTKDVWNSDSVFGTLAAIWAGLR